MGFVVYRDRKCVHNELHQASHPAYVYECSLGPESSLDSYRLSVLSF